VALLPEPVDYTAKDFDALRSRLIALLQSVFPDWTDFDVASFGNVLLEMYAFVGDVLTFYQDSQARESRLVTATQAQERHGAREDAGLPAPRSPGRRRSVGSAGESVGRRPTAWRVSPTGS
jgi:hypothetical protein